MSAIAELVRDEMSVLGLEVAAEGNRTIQVKTPNVVHDIGSIVRRLESVCGLAVVDVVVSSGDLELLVSWSPSRSSNRGIIAILVAVFAAALALFYKYYK
jgi:hypothetical protein